MLLAIDIGNTNVHLGLFRGKKRVKDWSVPSRPDWSFEKYFSLIKPVLARSAKRDEAISKCAIASVVPVLTRIFQKVGMEVSREMPLIVNAKNCGGLKVKVDRPKEVGADRLVNALAAYELYGAPAIVVDFGTAVTFDLVSARKEYLGGVIAAGLQITAEALARRTALLPEIKLAQPRRVRGTNTVACLQSGIYYGAIGLIEALVPRLCRELRWRRPKLILTGGHAPLISSGLQIPHILAPKLTLQGLQLLSRKMRRS